MNKLISYFIGDVAQGAVITNYKTDNLRTYPLIDTLLLTGIFVSLLAGQFARIELISSLANVYVHEFLILAFIAYGIYRFGISPVKKLLLSKSVLTFLLLVIFSFVFSLPQFTTMQNGIAFLYLVRVVLYVLFGVYLFKLLSQNKQARTTVFRLIYTFSILLLGVTAIQYIFFPNFWDLYALGWDPHLYRASAGYFDVFIAAAIYGMLTFFWWSKGKRLLAVLFMIALVLSLSRSAYIAFSIGLVYLFISQKKWKLLGVSLLSFIFLVVVMPKPFGEGGNLLRTASINSRILDYKLGGTLLLHKPIFGYGYNRIRFAKEQLGLAQQDDKSHSLAAFHSSFLMILVTTGIVGFGACIALLVSFLNKYEEVRVYLVYLSVMSLFDNVLLHVLVILPLLFLVAHLRYSSLE